ncbi:MAG: esterase [Muribaculaceae bacterium]|nr:esterase [Muribaculaceae bacterium]MDE7080785.1 esterase [Muribaculaceae bacterium]
MKNSYSPWLLATMLLAMPHLLPAQEALRFQAAGSGPQVNSDSTVTLSVHAPNAKTVEVSGFGATPLAMRKDAASGDWTVTTPTLRPDLYTYSFNIDSVRTIDPANAYIARDINALFSEVIVPGGNADLYAVQDVPHGTVSKVWYDSPTLGMKRRMTVYTPAGYEESGEKRYPVFYLLHGSGGDEEAWSQLGRAVQILDNLIASGQAEPMILVMPNGNANLAAAPGETSAGMYEPKGEHSRAEEGKFESSFKDIIGYVDSHYRTIADKEHRAIAGLSMGGGHALRTSLMMPDTFDYVGIFSGAARWNGGAPSADNQEFVAALRRQFADAPQLYWIGIGKDDFLYDLNQGYRSILDTLSIPYEYHESDGGHIWSNWRDYLVIFAPRLFRNA